MKQNQDVPHAPLLFVEVEVKDKEGKVIQRHKQEAKSFLYGFMLILNELFSGDTSPNAQNPANNCASCSMGSAGNPIFSVVAPSGNDNYGILIGSGNTPNNVNTCALQSLISNSTMSYGQTAFAGGVNTNSTNNTVYFQIQRQFTNNSGNSVTIAEVGLAIQGGGCYPLIARDVLSSSVTVPNGGTLTVTYTIQLTIS